MSRPAWPATLLLFAAVLSGCGGAGSQGIPPFHTPPPQLVRGPATAVGGVTALLQRIEASYESGEFDTIRRQFADSRLATAFTSQLQTWDADRAHPLHV